MSIENLKVVLTGDASALDAASEKALSALNKIAASAAALDAKLSALGGSGGGSGIVSTVKKVDTLDNSLEALGKTASKISVIMPSVMADKGQIIAVGAKAVDKLNVSLSAVGTTVSNVASKWDKFAQAPFASLTAQAEAFDAKARRLNTTLNYTDRSMKNLGTSVKEVIPAPVVPAVKNVERGLANMSTTGRRANFAMISLSQGISDLPYGFTAIANNIQQTIQGFNYLQESAGGTKGALKELGAALKGPTGLFIGISAVTAAATFLIQKYGSLSAAVEHLAGSWSKMDQAHQDFMEALKSAEKPYSDAITSVSELQSQVDLAKRGILSQSTVLSNYNKTLGEAFGTASNFANVEKKITDNAEAYIQATFKKGLATAFFQKASDAMVKSLEDQNKTSSEITSVWGKLAAAAKSITLGTKIKSIFSPWAALNGIFKDLNKSYDKNLDDMAAGDKRLSQLTGQNAFAENTKKAKTAYEEAAAAFEKIFGGPGKPPPSGLKSISDIMAKLKEDFATIANKATAMGLSLEQIGSAEIKALESAFDQIAAKGGPKTVAVLKQIDEQIKQIRKDNFLPVLSGGQAKVSTPGAGLGNVPTTAIGGIPTSAPIGDQKKFGKLQDEIAPLVKEVQKLGVFSDTTFSNLQDNLTKNAAAAGVLDGLFSDMFSALATGQDPFKALLASIEQLIIQLGVTIGLVAVLNAIPGGSAVLKALDVVGGLASAIPSHAKGAFVPGPQLAVVGDAPGGEWVLNQKQISAILNGSGAGAGQRISLSGTFRVSGNDLVATVNNTNKRNGRIN